MYFGSACIYLILLEFICLAIWGFLFSTPSIILTKVSKA